MSGWDNSSGLRLGWYFKSDVVCQLEVRQKALGLYLGSDQMFYAWLKLCCTEF